MFKRITKKQKKQEIDDELGLDEDTKQMFGMHDTDSDESNSSDSDEDSDLSDAGSELDDGLDRNSTADMTMEWLDAAREGSEDEDDTDEEGLDLDEQLDDEPPLQLSEALKNPIYLASMDQDIRACIVCPNKLLKNNKMVELHIESAAHVRRFKKFRELAESRKFQSKDPRRIAAAILQKPKVPTSNEDGTSKRALKRKEKQAALKKKREVTKQIIERKKKEREKKEAKKEKKEALAANKGVAATEDSESDGDEDPSARPPQKKRKVTKIKDGEGDGADIGDQTVMTGPSKTKTKAKAKAKAKADVNVEVDEPEVTEPVLKPKGKAKASKSGSKPTDMNATITKDAFAPPTKKSKASKSKPEPKAISGKTKPSDSGAPSGAKLTKDKSDRNVKPNGKSGASNPKKTARYFDGAENGTSPKDSGPKAGAKQKEKSSEGNRKLSGKTQNKRKRGGTDDLQVFD